MVTTDQSRAAAAPPGWADPQPPAQTGSQWRRALPLLLWLGCLTLAIALLLVLGQGRLAAPALTDPGAWRAWATGRDPLEVTMVVLRLLALGCAWYLTGVTSISVVARLLRAVRLVRLADALSVGPIRHLVQQAVGISLAAGVLATAVPAAMPTGRAAAGPRDHDVAVMTAVTGDEAATEAASAPDAPDVPDAPGTQGAPTVTVEVPVPVLQASAPPVSPRPTASTAPAGSTTSEGVPTPEVAPVPVATAASDTSSRSGTEARAAHEVRVRAGDHFWAMAEEAVAAHLGRPGTEVEVAVHWEALVASNADRLVVAGNPDLLMPGQLVVMPPVEVQP